MSYYLPAEVKPNPDESLGDYVSRIRAGARGNGYGLSLYEAKKVWAEFQVRAAVAYAQANAREPEAVARLADAMDLLCTYSLGRAYP